LNVLKALGNLILPLKPFFALLKMAILQPATGHGRHRG
jgi:hypothetical protein